MGEGEDGDMFPEFGKEGVEEDTVEFAVGDTFKHVIFVTLGEKE